ncbi:MAG: bifunctional 4-hydroxy-2-oxoglutarate aldolase/2-dehydro-3-deoxy-phosphogluconate aldolase [Trueperaceae bacterium]|nr:MAG: bifunctional 4-hydroxy-2-oxoglutarate aldolase/2-dehydro-3-deoxy-phosphogluconate aldolase [Trueperaceae bacterium]
MSAKTEVLERIAETRLVAILRLPDLSRALRLSVALLEGGANVQEFTLTNPEALEAIEEVRAKLPAFNEGQAAIGAGSVRNLAEAEAAITAGAQFIVTPITQLEVIAACKEAGVAIIPGAFTPTEIATAWEAGADFVKVFPARVLGPGYIKDILAPMPYLKLMPTGGVDLENLGTYLDHGAVAVGVGGNLLDKEAIRRGDWEKIAATATSYTTKARR